MTSDDSLRRWRLILGRYAVRPLAQGQFSAGDWKLDQTLEYFYGREYDGRGLARPSGGGGSLDPSPLRAVDWLARSRKLFPQDVFERMQTQAIERHQLDDLLKDPAVLRSLDPSPGLAKALPGLRGRLSGEMRDAVREVIRKTVDEITRRLKSDFVNALSPRICKHILGAALWLRAGPAAGGDAAPAPASTQSAASPNEAARPTSLANRILRLFEARRQQAQAPAAATSTLSGRLLAPVIDVLDCHRPPAAAPRRRHRRWPRRCHASPRSASTRWPPRCARIWTRRRPAGCCAWLTCARS